mgnify:FL=1
MSNLQNLTSLGEVLAIARYSAFDAEFDEEKESLIRFGFGGGSDPSIFKYWNANID